MPHCADPERRRVGVEPPSSRTVEGRSIGGPPGPRRSGGTTMLRRSIYGLAGAVATTAVLALGAPLAAGAPGPGAEGTIRLDGPIVACDGSGLAVGRARFRDDFDGRQRFELRADAPDASGATFTAVGRDSARPGPHASAGTFPAAGRDFAGPGLPATATLDDQGKARLEVRVGPDDAERFEVTGPNPNIDIEDATGAAAPPTARPPAPPG